METAREEVIGAVLSLLSAQHESYAHPEYAGTSFQLDWAHDRLTEALEEYAGRLAASRAAE